MNPLDAVEEVEADTNSYTIFTFIPALLYRVLSFFTISIPSTLYTLLSYTLTVSLDFYSLVLILCVLIVCSYLFIRYRLLTKYSRLPSPPPEVRNPVSFDLHPDTTSDDEEPPLKIFPGDFLKVFLASIKVFGYLERPVLDELARHLQTRKLLAGEVLSLSPEKERSFIIVVEGSAKVFVRGAGRSEKQFELLHEVKQGGSLSSLFTLLAMLSEDVPLRHEEERPKSFRRKSFVSNMEDNSEFSPAIPTTEQSQSHPFMAHTPSLVTSFRGDFSRTTSSESSPSLVESSTPSVASYPDYFASSIFERRDSFEPMLPGSNIFARASVDTTLAVIPIEAFHRVMEKFPNAGVHMIQVILTRFQRMTFLTLTKYLGMTKEILQIEKKVNDLSNYGLPPGFCKPASLEKLRAKLVSKESPPLTPRKSPSKLRSPKAIRKENQRWSTMSDYGIHSPSRRPLLPLDDYFGHDAIRQEYGDVDINDIKDAVFECISKSIGLVQSTPVAKPQHRYSDQFDFLNSPFEEPDSVGFNDDVETDSVNTANTNFTNSSLHSGISELDNEVELLHFAEDSVLVKEGERTEGLYFVIDGVLDVSIQSKPINESHAKSGGKPKRARTAESMDARPSMRSLYLIKPGGLAGYLSGLSGYPSVVTIKASSDSLVGYLSRHALDRIVERHPAVLLTLAKRLITHLSPLILHIDFALEWYQASAGKVIYKEGDPSEFIDIVLNGRLRSISQRNDRTFTIIGEYGQGDSIGELEVMTDLARKQTLYAIRDSELARMPKTLLHSLAMTHPQVTFRISRMIANRTYEAQAASIHKSVNPVRPDGVDLGQNNMNLKTVCLLPVSSDVPIAEFSIRLRDAMNDVGVTNILLNHANVLSILGKHAFSRLGKLKMASWLADQEENVGIVLYVADSGVNSPWTQRCIRQADCILLIGLGDGSPAVGEFERLLINMKTTARKELILLHQDHNCPQGTTRQWLKQRAWIHAYHHVQMKLRRTPTLNQDKRKNKLVDLKDQLQDQFQKYYSKIINKPSYTYGGSRSDFARLARRLCGKSVGLVLGGGGAKGIAHIGLIRALEEAGIPVDMVGGTSIGAFIGGLYARDPDTVSIYGRAKMFSGRMSSYWRLALDFTYPAAAWFTGTWICHEFNRGIWKCFSDTQIEDLWLPYFCVTTNITLSRIETHRMGYLWRYVRASMSLSGFLPPLCDNGNMLVDGGYMDNLPVSYMKSMGAEKIFAFDVAAEDDNSPATYGDSLSGWRVLLHQLNPFSRQRIPTLTEIQSRLAYVSCVRTLEEAKNIEGCMYSKVPVQQFGVLEFNRFEEIYQIGYEHGKETLRKWQEQGLLDHWLKPKSGTEKQSRKNGRRNSI
ncbi:patatin-domain-containing protein [Basidiobolus meristosporus CBS 931.73]|uniref:Lysophospholipase NTE1 n=1 Tax=Basidiobolus meristosporus CBS 931.73 TaxID=1314790 RepID=A0A1Y1Z4Z8_9FUNG|nr:patatin-domain-containing protein [Basidiobolus meristosporus CBS 931.73]|eukprot:ORY05330.1 patatin-domain-containing protein [Basidiobolus meristosporus CBS 931.73]